MFSVITNIYIKKTKGPWNKILHVSDSSSVHHQGFFTVHTAIHTGLLIACKQSANLYVLLCVQSKTADDGQRNCPKHVKFYSKHIFEKLVLLVGFIT